MTQSDDTAMSGQGTSGTVSTEDLVLQAADGAQFAAYLATAERPSVRILILPDVRGLVEFYKTLAERLAHLGARALAIDYFGRTAGIGERPADFDYMAHVTQTDFAGQRADLDAALEKLREGDGSPDTYTIGFSFGGRFSYVCGTLGLGLAGVVGFYGQPVGPGRNDVPAPIDVIDHLEGPLLGIYGTADAGNPAEKVGAFEERLRDTGATYRLLRIPDAPHSFFDRRADEFPDGAREAWDAILAFIAPLGTGAK